VNVSERCDLQEAKPHGRRADRVSRETGWPPAWKGDPRSAWRSGLPFPSRGRLLSSPTGIVGIARETRRQRSRQRPTLPLSPVAGGRPDPRCHTKEALMPRGLLGVGCAIVLHPVCLVLARDPQ